MRKAFVLIVIVLLAGCRTKIEDREITVAVEPGLNRYLTVDPTAKAQNVNVSAKSTGGELFNVFIFLEKDKQEAEKAIDQNKTSEKILKERRKTSQADLQVPVPGNETAVVMITAPGGKKAEVKVRLSN